MNPTNNEAGMNLPPPVSEQVPFDEATVEAAAKATPEAPASAEKAGGKTSSPAAGLAALPALPIDIPSQGADQPAVRATTDDSSQTIADDGDLIEKEWVDKAKKIVEHTRDDPYRQSEELTVVKAEYMKKRYDKTVKVNK
jgi:hypothetical protein